MSIRNRILVTWCALRGFFWTLQSVLIGENINWDGHRWIERERCSTCGYYLGTPAWRTTGKAYDSNALVQEASVGAHDLDES